MAASLDIICFLCTRQCRSIAAAIAYLQRDPVFEDVLRDDALRLSSMATQLLEDRTRGHGARVLRLAVAKRLLLRILDRKDAVVWLVRDHPEALTILMNAAGFDGVCTDEVSYGPSRPERVEASKSMGRSKIVAE